MANTRVTTPVTDFDKTNTTQGLKLPSGTNSNQPAGVDAIQGMLRNYTEETVDSSASALTHYNGTNWQYFAATESRDPLPANIKMYLDASDSSSYPGTGTTWFDLTDNDNDATLSGPTWNNAGYFEFNGSSNYGTIPHSNDLNSSNSFSVEAWVNRDDDGDGSILRKETNASTQYGWHLVYGNGFFEGYQFKLWSNSNYPYIASAYQAGSGTAGDWQHVVGTFDGLYARIYVDGVFQRASVVWQGGTVSANTTQVVLGSNYQLNYLFWDGKISKTRIYDTALSAAEIETLFTEGR